MGLGCLSCVLSFWFRHAIFGRGLDVMKAQKTLCRGIITSVYTLHDPIAK